MVGRGPARGPGPPAPGGVRREEGGHAGWDRGSERGVRREEAEHQRQGWGLLLRGWVGGGGRARGALGEKV